MGIDIETLQVNRLLMNPFVINYGLMIMDKCVSVHKNNRVVLNKYSFVAHIRRENCMCVVV